MARSKPLFSYPASLVSKHFIRSGTTSEHERWADAILPADVQASPLESETNRRPIMLFGLIISGVFVILVAQLFRLQVIGGNRNLGLADGNRINQTITRAPRGVIYDRNHQPLAENVASFDVTITPQLVPKKAADRQRIFSRVSQIIGTPTASLEQLAANTKINPLQPQLVTSNLDRDKALLFDQESTSLTGFSLDVNPVRQYLDGGLDGDILGYTGRVSQTDLTKDSNYLPTDYVGKAGIEEQYDSLLRGINGTEQTEVDSERRPIKVLDNKAAMPGSSIELTIDQGLQAKLTQNLQAQMTKAGATQAAGVALNPKTGEVLALVSLPGYDSNQFAHGISPGDYLKLVNNAAQPLFNKAASGAYPTGSIIKPLVASAALQEGTITPATTVTDKGFIQIPNPYNPAITYTYRSWEPGGLGTLDLEHAIAMSSDIYFYSVGGGFGNVKGLGVNLLTSWYQKFGLGKKTGIDLPTETSGRVPTPAWKQKAYKEPWYLGDTFNISVGQGDLLASPLQMASALSTIVNDGIIIKPHLLKQVTDSNGQITQTSQPVTEGKLAISQAYFQTVKDAMRLVITSGTGCCYIQQYIPVPVAGKTGTAETDPGSGRKPDAWFEAFAPYNDPQVVMVGLVQNAGEGANVAAPAVRDTLAWYFNPH